MEAAGTNVEDLWKQKQEERDEEVGFVMSQGAVAGDRNHEEERQLRRRLSLQYLQYVRYRGLTE